LENPERQFYWECCLSELKSFSKEALAVNWFWIDEINPMNWKQNLTSLIQSFKLFYDETTNNLIWWQNVAFDISFLKKSAEETGVNLDIWHRFFDLHSVAYWIILSKWMEIPKKNWKENLSLDEILKIVWLPEEPKPHIWINWAKYEAEAISRLLYSKNLLPEFQKYPVLEITKTKNITQQRLAKLS
jgi:hypothetical protein